MNNEKLIMAVPDLLTAAINGVFFARRDIDIMRLYGIDEDFILRLETDTNRLRNTPGEEELQEAISALVREKECKAEVVRSTIHSFIERAKIVFGADSPEVKGFDTAEIDMLADDELIHTAQVVKHMSMNKLVQLSAKGLNKQMIEDFGVQVDQFDGSIDDITEGERAYLEGIMARYTLALRVNKHVSDISEYGKNHWRGKDDSKYADYDNFDKPADEKTVAVNGTILGSDTNASKGDAFEVLSGTNPNAITEKDDRYSINTAPVATYSLNSAATGMKTSEKVKMWWRKVRIVHSLLY